MLPGAARCKVQTSAPFPVVDRQPCLLLIQLPCLTLWIRVCVLLASYHKLGYAKMGQTLKQLFSNKKAMRNMNQCCPLLPEIQWAPTC